MLNQDKMEGKIQQQTSSSVVGNVMNSKGKSTPGPWKLRRPPTPTGFYLVTPKGGISVVCDELPESLEEWQANARLIVAAPDLLDALETLYHLVSEVANPDAFDNGVYAPDGRCEGDVLAGEVIEQARIAIAKTKGERG